MFRRKDPGLAEANLLDIRPIRTAGWSEVDAEVDAETGAESASEGAEPASQASRPRVTVERDLPPARGLTGWMHKLSFLTGVKTLRLDELGSAAWRRLDGSRSVAQVVEELRQEFGEGCEPAEERLGMFLGMLRRERLIGYPGWDDERIDSWKQRT